MNDHNAAMIDLATRLFDAVQSGDVTAVRAIYAPDVAIWHNYDGVTQSGEQNLKTLALASAAIKDFRYEDVRLTPTPTGFVQQHVLRGTAPDGSELRVPACIVCIVVDGRITRLDEYFDSAHIAALVPQR